jgi:two-component system sensor histidine kinase QseC
MRRMKLLRQPHSLQGRLLALVLVVVVGVWLLTALATWRDARHELDELLDGHLAQAAALLVAQQAQEAEEDERPMDAPTLHRYAPKVAFQVFHENRLALRSANAPTTPLMGAGRHLKTGFETVQIDGADWRIFAAQGAERDVQVYVGEEMSSRASILWAVLRSMLWPMALALPLLGLAVWWAVYLGVKPLRRLGHTLAERQPQSLAPLTLDGAPLEMAPVVDALNGLFERIGLLLESERRFTADAAHELRTPIAAIRTQAQVAMGEPDPALRRHALQGTLEGCDRAIRLVEQLLTLARLEGVAASAMNAVDLRALAQRAVAQVAPKAIAKQQTLEFDADAPCSIPGNETLLAVLVRNLVDNAVRYSPPGARVKVALRQQAGQLVLSVEDSGPGLDAADLKRLGERFFRVPGSAESGSGLGWSIVQRIAAVHALTLQAAPSAELGGLAVRVLAKSAHENPASPP